MATEIQATVATTLDPQHQEWRHLCTESSVREPAERSAGATSTSAPSLRAASSAESSTAVQLMSPSPGHRSPVARNSGALETVSAPAAMVIISAGQCETIRQNV